MSNQLTNLTITDNTQIVREALEMAKLQALTAIGMTAEGYAKEETPVNLGTLRNSITHAVDGDSVVIGTNVEYAAFVEEGTGIYASNGNGRKDPWVYFDEATGKFRLTHGSKPHHMLRKAATEHTDEYKDLVKQAFKAAE
ncbi:MAG: HK97 gp10 family phage protein [Ruminococcus sp.]|nr:HK97 gp10 family phage protein [Ruminococcus sp.]MCM1380326.1 HK97 gp10 family phage protein [Muribaculaceae bacterium]MCM1478238.1 HK97 gp10 family phage protein [Muribaculaceae bacterium]